MNFGTKSTKSCARSRRSRSARWVCGTKTLRRPTTTKCTGCWPPPGSATLHARPNPSRRRHMAQPTFHGSPPAAVALSAVREAALPLGIGPIDYSALLDLVGDSRFVLLGEASHGTEDFYRERAEITKRLIVENRLSAVAVEADWPDAYRVNRYVRGTSDDRDADAALSGFQRFPAWMWRNTVVLEFVEWLREYNHRQPQERRVGF